MNTKDRKIDEKVRASYQAALSKDYEKAIEINSDAYDTRYNRALTLKMMEDNPKN